MYDRNQLGRKILDHWLVHHPEMVKDLVKNNQLEQTLIETQERTGDLLYELLTVQKMDYQTAWEMATREWGFLPTEDRPPQPLSTSFTANLKGKPPAISE